MAETRARTGQDRKCERKTRQGKEGKDIIIIIDLYCHKTKYKTRTKQGRLKWGKIQMKRKTK